MSELGGVSNRLTGHDHAAATAPLSYSLASPTLLSIGKAAWL